VKVTIRDLEGATLQELTRAGRRAPEGLLGLNRQAAGAAAAGPQAAGRPPAGGQPAGGQRAAAAAPARTGGPGRLQDYADG